MQARRLPPDAVFFDLDGTLADTADDLAAALNAMRAARNLDVLPVAHLRPYVSRGARGMLEKGFGLTSDAPEYEALRVEFLTRYEQALVVHTRLFEGMPEVLERLEAEGILWGVVSNKAERFVRPVLASLGLLERSATAIGGDTTAHPKPHPAPLLHAAELTRVAPERCFYIGDDRRDVEAGHAAGMFTVAAEWGFFDRSEPPSVWGAGALAATPSDLLALFGLPY